jgi:hypothetical protein
VEVSVARLVLTRDEASVCEVVGVKAFVQARSLVSRGDLVDMDWDRQAGRGQAVVRGETTDWVTASIVIGADGANKSVSGTCTCVLAPGCAHPTALVLAAYTFDTLRPQSAPSWELALAALVGGDSPSGGPGSADLALQFDLEDEGRSEWRIGLRPVVPGKKGWIRSGISWPTLDYAYTPGSPRAQHHVDLLLEVLALADGEDHDPYRYYGPGQRVVYLDEFRSRRVWDVLAEAQEAGLPMVQSGRAASLVRVAAQPVRFSVRADRVDAGLRLRPVLADGAEVLDPDRSVLVGRPAHGVAWWGTTGQASPKDPGTLRLAPLARPVSVQVMEALAAPAIVVPAADESRFLRQYYSRLAGRARAVSLRDFGSTRSSRPARAGPRRWNGPSPEQTSSSPRTRCSGWNTTTTPPNRGPG